MRVLVVVHASRHPEVCEEMQKVLEIREPDSPTGEKTPSSHKFLAIRNVGTRHHGTAPNRPGQPQILYSYDGLFHQVGRSQPSGNHQRKGPLIFNNGTQFDGRLFRGFCEELKIEFYNSTPAYPQSNGQAKASNKTILDELKKRLEKAKRKWNEELPTVIWAYRTTPRHSTRKMPFALAFGMEAVIPLEIRKPTIRIENFDPGLNAEAIALKLDLVEEHVKKALIHTTAYQQELSKKYNKAVNLKQFKVGDWVLRKVMGNTLVLSKGKLGANWEGPYKITGLASKWAYSLADLDSKAIPRLWNAANLKLYYF
ncbi:unnamed protein product [Camellia sinensis]